MKRLAGGLLMFLSLLLIGCGPKWVVIQQGPAEKFANKPAFTVLPVDSSAATVNGVAQGQLDAETQKDWEGARASFAEHFQSQLMDSTKASGLAVTPGATPAAGSLVLKPAIVSASLGKFAGVYQRPSETVMRLDITTADGAAIDQLQFTRGTPGSVVNAAAQLRLMRDGIAIGDDVAAYLAGRTAAK